MNDRTHHIRERFPDKKDSIDRLLVEDPNFLSLCEDYDVCVNALSYWTKSKEPEAETRCNEYRALICEIEEDITQTLADLKTRKLN